MPTTRRRIPRTSVSHRITPEVIEAWRIGDQNDVDRLLNVGGQTFSPFDVDDAGNVVSEPLLASPPGSDLGFELAVRLRRALLEICPPGRVGRHGDPLGPEDAD
jgi:hypothetical protein